MFNFPEIPADLSSLTNDELRALESSTVEEWGRVAGGDIDGDAYGALESATANVERIRAELSARDQAEAERAEGVAEMQRRLGVGGEGENSAGSGGNAASTTTAPSAPTTPPTPNSDAGNTTNDGGGSTGAPASSSAPSPASVSAGGNGGSLPTLPPGANGGWVWVNGGANNGGNGGPITTTLTPSPTNTLQPFSTLPTSSRAPAAPIRPDEVILAAADIPGYTPGQTLDGLEGIAEAIVAKRKRIGPVPSGAPSEDIIVASIPANYPEERVLTNEDAERNWRRIYAVTSPQAITAAGGLCAPVTPYYNIMTLAGASRPLRDSLPGFDASRGGITFLPPPQWSAAGDITRTVTDGATNTNTTVTSATAAFTTADVGASISGTGVAAGTYIVSVESATSVTVSAATTATATGVTLTIVRRGSVSLITADQDASALGGTLAQQVIATKPCIHATCPSPSTVKLAAISRCIEFSNMTTRAYPEQVPAWLSYVMAVWARRGETAILDAVTTASTAVTQTGVMGVSRELPAELIKAAAYYRNRNRMDRNTPLRVWLPEFVLDMVIADQIRGSGYELEYYTQAAANWDMALREARLNVTYYLDSPTGVGQLMNAGAQHTATTLTTWPATVVWFMFAEGSFLFGDGGTLDFGLVRDSALNSTNVYRIFSETFEAVAGVGVESLKGTCTVAANGTFAGPAYGSTTVSSPVAIGTNATV